MRIHWQELPKVLQSWIVPRLGTILALVCGLFTKPN